MTDALLLAPYLQAAVALDLHSHALEPSERRHLQTTIDRPDALTVALARAVFEEALGFLEAQG